MSTSEEGQHTLPDGFKVFTKTWKPSADAKAAISFFHGFSDHCSQYDEFFSALAANGIEVFSFDQRGWGRSVQSPSQQGDTGPTTVILDDMTSFIEATLKRTKAPLFIMGHSMGGGEVLTYASQGPSSTLSQIRGILVESPFCALGAGSKPWPGKIFLGRLAGTLLPKFQIKNPLDVNKIGRDPAHNRIYAEDPLCHDTGTLECLAEMLDRAAKLESGEIKIKEGTGFGGRTRLWVSHGTADDLCDFAGTKSFYERGTDGIQDKELKAYEGWYHQLHAEPGEDKKQYWKDVTEWVLARAS